MKGTLQATDEQQQVLTQQGMATVMTEQEQYDDLAVTAGGVTVAPDIVIVDDRFAYLSFKVRGYELEAGKEPCFESMDVYVGDDSDSEDSWINSSGNFYYGIVTDENGSPVYDDGTPVQFDADGNWSFTIDLPTVSTSKTIEVNRSVDGTVFALDSIEISPISVKMNYSVNGEVAMQEDENGVPDFCPKRLIGTVCAMECKQLILCILSNKNLLMGF